MKKHFGLLLALLLTVTAAVCLLTFSASAETVNGTCGKNGNNLTWSLDTSTGVLNITGTGPMADYLNYSSMSAPWYSYRSSVKSVTIGNSVTSIGLGAFYRCSSLTSITIPDSVTSIGNDAFYECTSLGSITIPDSVTRIGNDAFYECTSLGSITIPDSVTYIEDGAFFGCTSLGSITVPIGNTAYCAVDGVLFNKNKTTLVCYPAGKTASSYTIPNGVTYIKKYAFSYCSSLTSVTIPDSVTSIGYFAFSSCSSLTSVHITDLAAWCRISFGSSNANPLSNAKNLYINGVLATDITIPDSVTSIGSSAFSGCRGLTSVTIPDGVTSIGSYAFDNCSSLTSVTIPDSVTSIGQYAFYGCSSLTSVTIPDSVTSIGDYAFYSCSSLTSVTIGNSVTSIGNYAFYNCTNMTSITIGNSVTSIGEYAFVRCTALTSITIPDSVTSIGEYAFYECTSLGSITIGNSVTSIGYAAFVRCTALTSITIPNSVTSIGNDAFTYSGVRTIRCIPGSYAGIYAQNNGYAVEYLGVTSVTLASPPTKTVYPIGGTLQTNGLTLNVTLDDGSVVTVSSGFTVEAYDFSTAGQKTVSVACTGFTVSFTVTVDASLIKYPESDHPYANNENQTWTYTHRTAADELHITFSADTKTESGYDYIYIYDASGAQVGTYSGTQLAGQTVIVEGNSFSIKLTSDGSGTYYGFAIDDIAAHTHTYIDGGCSCGKWLQGRYSVYEGTAAVTKWTNASATEAVIPSSIAGYPVTSIGSSAFYGCTSLASITIPNSVTSIGGGAFSRSGVRTIRCIPGSYADIYAQNNGYAVEYLGVTSVTLASPPTKTVYPIGGTLKTDGLTLNVTLDDGSVVTVSSGFTVGAYDFSTAGQKTVSVACTGFTVSFTVTVDATLIEYPESDHPYANSTNQTWTYTHPTAADELHITFSADTKTESGYDYIYIYDASGAQVGKYSGTQLAGQTVIVEGNSFSIKLTSDGSYNYYGFAIDDITAVGGGLPGDFDGDGSVTNSDITLLIRYLSGWTDTGIGATAADVNLDGKINNRDAIALIRDVAGRESQITIPAEPTATGTKKIYMAYGQIGYGSSATDPCGCAGWGTQGAGGNIEGDPASNTGAVWDKIKEGGTVVLVGKGYISNAWAIYPTTEPLVFTGKDGGTSYVSTGEYKYFNAAGQKGMFMIANGKTVTFMGDVIFENTVLLDRSTGAVPSTYQVGPNGRMVIKDTVVIDKSNDNMTPQIAPNTPALSVMEGGVAFLHATGFSNITGKGTVVIDKALYKAADFANFEGTVVDTDGYLLSH